MWSDGTLVLGTIAALDGHRFIGRYLGQQFGQHGRIAHAVVRHLNGPYLQRACINTQVHLAPLPPVFGTVLLSFPIPFTQEFDACAVHQQIHRRSAILVGQLHLQCLLTPADGAEVGNPPIELGQVQQALNEAQALAQGQPKKTLDTQAKLNGCIREGLLAASFATGGHVPLHVCMEPDRQQPSGLERGVVRSPAGGLVAVLWPFGFIDSQSLAAQSGGFVRQSISQTVHKATTQ
jgi:hypothetical protein